ncbi:MAG: hypothetical protein C4321_04225, partial [Chloroflexota bacterium]
ALVGGIYVGLNGRNCYEINHGRVTANRGGTLTLTDVNPALKRDTLGEFTGPGIGYVTNTLAVLDAPGEWFWG